MKYIHKDGTAWPDPQTTGNLNNVLRHGVPTKSDLLCAASIISAYTTLFWASRERRAEIFKTLKDGHRGHRE